MIEFTPRGAIVGDSREIRMIGYIKGTVLFVGGGDGREVVVEAGQSGVGYRILMALSEVSSLEVGAQAELHVYTQVREDAIELYGFRTADERTLFTRLVTVNGVGAKLALSILDTLTPGELQNAVLTGDTATLKRVSGIGPKVAARVILELESFLRTCHFGELMPEHGRGAVSKSSHLDTRSALANLGFAEAEIERVIGELDASGEQMDVQAEIVWCLRHRG